MPFLALADETRVLPHQVSSEMSLTCPACGEAMGLVTAHRRNGTFVAQHFRHQGEDTCRGESDTHRRMKLIAFSKLAHTYPAAEVVLEASVGDRRADVLVQFPEARFPLGHGIAVEVQHLNNSKSLLVTEQDYYDAGYSVLWLTKQDFSGYDVSIPRIQSVWPEALPRLRGYGGLSWPVESVEADPVVECDIPFPPELIDAHKESLRAAFERGRDQRAALTGEDSGRPVFEHQDASTSEATDEPSWHTHSQVWLSQPHHSTNRSLQYVEAPSGMRFLKLSKGKRGVSPEFVSVPLTATTTGRLETVRSLLQRAPDHSPSNGEWEDLDTCWLTPRSHELTAWLRLVSTPSESYAFQLGKKSPSGKTEEVTVSFSLSAGLQSSLQAFFETIVSADAE